MASPTRQQRGARLLIPLLGLALAALLLAGCLSGLVELSAPQLAAMLLDRLGWRPGWGAFGETEAVVFWSIRLPRVLLGTLTGAALGLSGACLQALFRNALADPGLIGVSAGSAVGAVAAIVLAPVATWLPAFLLLPAMAMAGGMAATALVYRVARIGGRTHVSTLLLAGVAVNALSGALVGGMIYLASGDQLRRFAFWTLGSLARAQWEAVAVVFACVLPAGLLLLRQRRTLNALLLGEAEAWHLGIDTARLKRALIALNALMVGAAVAFCGLIGFVGLVVPHCVRLLAGPDHRLVLPGSALLGAVLVLAADLLARQVNPPAELPIGILTALLGAPFFLYLILQRKRQAVGD
jgi:iron complex transport system permease protein